MSTILEPDVGITGFTAAQPYHLVIVGEKSSLRPVLADVANRKQADLYLPTGEISDTQIHTIACHAVGDGRPMVVLYFADADPAGWQMPISLSRKLQAFQALGYDFEFRVYRVALTPDQVREYGLPSTPLKDTERRADKWTAAMGVQQTEIDALAALRPGLLRQIAENAIAPFYDAGLDDRVSAAADEWETEAREAIEEQDPELAARRERVAGRLGELRDQIDTLLDEVRVDADDFELPDIPEVLEPEVDEEDQPVGLCDSRWSFAEQCRRLRASKDYRLDDDDDDVGDDDELEDDDGDELEDDADGHLPIEVTDKIWIVWIGIPTRRRGSRRARNTVALRRFGLCQFHYQYDKANDDGDDDGENDKHDQPVPRAQAPHRQHTLPRRNHTQAGTVGSACP